MAPEVDSSRTAFREGLPQDAAELDSTLSSGEGGRAEVNA